MASNGNSAVATTQWRLGSVDDAVSTSATIREHDDTSGSWFGIGDNQGDP